MVDTSKYGGYKSQKTAYFALVVSYGKKNEEIKTIEEVPVLTAYRAKADIGALQRYFDTYLKAPKILIPKIKTKQLVSYNGTLCYITGVTSGNRLTAGNGVQLHTDNKIDEYVKALSELSDMKAKGTITGDEKEILKRTNRYGERKLVINSEHNVVLLEFLTKKLNAPIYSGISAFATIKNIVQNGFDKFIALTVYQQSYVLLQLFKFLKSNTDSADMVLIGGSKESGKIAFGKNITNVDFRLIDLSPAGLTERVRKV